MKLNSPLVFLSYCHADDQWARGKISAFRDGLVEALRIVTGKSIHVFQDRDIEWGQHWPDTLEKALAEATFLMPIVTPSYFESAACRKELEAFVEYEKHGGSGDRILPIYWRDCARWQDPEQRRADELASELYDRQYRDWRGFVNRSPKDPQVRRQLESIAHQIASQTSLLQNSRTEGFSVPEIGQ